MLNLAETLVISQKNRKTNIESDFQHFLSNQRKIMDEENGDGRITWTDRWEEGKVWDPEVAKRREAWGKAILEAREPGEGRDRERPWLGKVDRWACSFRWRNFDGFFPCFPLTEYRISRVPRPSKALQNCVGLLVSFSFFLSFESVLKEQLEFFFLRNTISYLLTTFKNNFLYQK